MKLKNAISSFLILSVKAFSGIQPEYGVPVIEPVSLRRPYLFIFGLLSIPIILIVGIIVFIKKRKKKK